MDHVLVIQTRGESARRSSHSHKLVFNPLFPLAQNNNTQQHRPSAGLNSHTQFNIESAHSTSISSQLFRAQTTTRFSVWRKGSKIYTSDYQYHNISVKILTMLFYQKKVGGNDDFLMIIFWYRFIYFQREKVQLLIFHSDDVRRVAVESSCQPRKDFSSATSTRQSNGVALMRWDPAKWRKGFG